MILLVMQLDVTDLDLYYQKVAKAFSDIPDSTSVLSADELQSRVEENRIVGPNTSGAQTNIQCSY